MEKGKPLMSHSLRSWLQIHFCVMLWGFTAILGKAISLPALPLVWWRMSIVTVVLLLNRGKYAYAVPAMLLMVALAPAMA